MCRISMITKNEYDRMEQENPAGEVNYRHFVMLGRTSRLMVSIKHAIFGKIIRTTY